MSIVDQENESFLVPLKLLRVPKGRSHRPWSLSKARSSVYSPICVNSYEKGIRKSVSRDFAVCCTRNVCVHFSILYIIAHIFILIRNIYWILQRWLSSSSVTIFPVVSKPRRISKPPEEHFALRDRQDPTPPLTQSRGPPPPLASLYGAPKWSQPHQRLSVDCWEPLIPSGSDCVSH